MKKVFLTFAALGLAACAQIDITTPPVPVTPNKPASAAGVDVYAGSRRAGNPVPEFRGQTTVEVRSYMSGGGPGQTEVAGAVCQIDGTAFNATVRTPAIIVVPDYGPHSPTLFASCKLGPLSGTKTIRPYNESRRQRNNSYGTVGLGIGHGFDHGIGVGIGLGLVATLGPRGQDRWEYPELATSLR